MSSIACAVSTVCPASTQALVEGREIEGLLIRFYQLLVRSGLQPGDTWVADEAQATIDTTTLAKYIGTLDNPLLSEPLSRLLKYLEAEDKVRISFSMQLCTTQVTALPHANASDLWTDAGVTTPEEAPMAASSFYSKPQHQPAAPACSPLSEHALYSQPRMLLPHCIHYHEALSRLLHICRGPHNTCWLLQLCPAPVPNPLPP